MSWQVVPAPMLEMMQEPGERADRVMSALLQMKKLDLGALNRAYAGGTARR